MSIIFKHILHICASGNNYVYHNNRNNIRQKLGQMRKQFYCFGYYCEIYNYHYTVYALQISL